MAGDHFGRLLHATSGHVMPIGRPVSLFGLRSSAFRSFGPPLARIFSQARLLEAATITIEKLPLEGELQEDLEDLLLRGAFGKLQTQVWRLCFFKGETSWPEVPLRQSSDFVGYAILREDKCSESGFLSATVHESVLQSLLRGHNYLRNEPVWKVRCGNVILRVSGHLFAQQNEMTTVCAHAAVRCAAATYKQGGGATYREMNSLLNIDHKNRRIGRGEEIEGLDIVDMKFLLEQWGARCQIDYYCPDLVAPGIRETLAAPLSSYQRSLYGSVESGYPALLVFAKIKTLGEGKDGPTFDNESFLHAIPIFGHTFNQDMWVPRAELSHFQFKLSKNVSYIPSDLWLSAFVGHDDGLGSNYCLPQHYLAPLDLNPLPQEKCGIVATLQTFPRDVLRLPLDAEVQALVCLHTIFAGRLRWFYRTLAPEAKQWVQRLSEAISSGQVVLRAILVTPAQYAEHLRSLKSWKGASCRDSVLTMASASLCEIPGHWWMVEISVMELFPANLRKLGEILVSATDMTSALDSPAGVACMRLPGIFLQRASATWNESSWLMEATNLDDHVQVYGTEQLDPIE